MKNPIFTTTKTALPGVFLRAMQEAYRTGANVRLVEIQDGMLVPALQQSGRNFISVWDARTPVRHPSDYPIIYRSEDGYVRSKAEAMNLVDCFI